MAKNNSLKRLDYLVFAESNGKGQYFERQIIAAFFILSDAVRYTEETRINNPSWHVSYITNQSSQGSFSD